MSWRVQPPLESYVSYLGTEYSDYSGEALSQATDLLLIVTGLERRPGPGEPESRLALEDRLYQRGIFSLAEAFELNRGTRSQALSPYRSEQIGSYRYELIAYKAKMGKPTGILWFDQAVEYFDAKTLQGEPDLVSKTTHLFDRFEPDLGVFGDDAYGAGDFREEVEGGLELRRFRDRYYRDRYGYGRGDHWDRQP